MEENQVTFMQNKYDENSTYENQSKYWFLQINPGENYYSQYASMKEVSYDSFLQYQCMKFYTDGGATSSSGGPGGYGVIGVESGFKKLEFNQSFKSTTNNRMELMAILCVVKSYNKDIYIATDSCYSIGCLTKFHFGWFKDKSQKNKIISNYDQVSKELKNKDLLFQILYYAQNKCVRLCHVKGHSGDKFNEMVDKLTWIGRDTGDIDVPYLTSIKVQHQIQKSNNQISDISQTIAKRQILEKFHQFTFHINDISFINYNVCNFDTKMVQYQEFQNMKGKKYFINGHYKSSKGGLGLIQIQDGIITELFSQGFQQSTSNRMVLIGMIVALQTLQNDEQFIVASSVKYPLDCFTQWLGGWLQKDFNGIANVELIKQNLCLMMGRKCTFAHVKSSLKDEYTIQSLKLASQVFNTYTKDNNK
ncbi:Ribonuclease H [Spironucleus salmonicida]|uniref:ribonuclease H n=1 Tax=Spironucleus salmonicida TaxID=348837 RepID=V6LQR1_9EUKA|nr:Ribonuclease H [Spironucleus salmonicida]|eukprot:EST46920.1 Ribonuclease H [Spironucleus salmonicida]